MILTQRAFFGSLHIQCRLAAIVLLIRENKNAGQVALAGAREWNFGQSSARSLKNSNGTLPSLSSPHEIASARSNRISEG